MGCFCSWGECPATKWIILWYAHLHVCTMSKLYTKFHQNSANDLGGMQLQCTWTDLIPEMIRTDRQAQWSFFQGLDIILMYFSRSVNNLALTKSFIIKLGSTIDGWWTKFTNMIVKQLVMLKALQILKSLAQFSMTGKYL